MSNAFPPLTSVGAHEDDAAGTHVLAAFIESERCHLIAAIGDDREHGLGPGPRAVRLTVCGLGGAFGLAR
jgi:hypothetical protein